MHLKITEKIIQENAFEQKKKKPGLSSNRSSNNWAHCSLGIKAPTFDLPSNSEEFCV